MGSVAYSAGRAATEGLANALRADLHDSGVGVTLAMFGTVETPYCRHNPGSREHLPTPAAELRSLSLEEAAALIVSAIENGTRTVIASAAFRFLFLLNRLFLAQIEASLQQFPRDAGA